MCTLRADLLVSICTRFGVHRPPLVTSSPRRTGDGRYPRHARRHRRALSGFGPRAVAVLLLGLVGSLRSLQRGRDSGRILPCQCRHMGMSVVAISIAAAAAIAAVLRGMDGSLHSVQTGNHSGSLLPCQCRHMGM